MFSVIFPGQGSQIVGMGKDLHSKYNIIKKLFKEADEILGFSISNIILEGPTFSVCWIKGDTIFTPSLNLGILDSVTRKYLYAI